MGKKILLIFLTILLACVCFSVTACKKEPNTYTVIFDTDGGTIVEEQKIKEGKKVSKPLDPTKIGYEFDDWYVVDEETPFDFENTSVNNNITLKARWNINQYSITFDSDGGTAVDTITQDYATLVSAPSAPIKTGYTFVGWFEDGETSSYAFNTIEARDVSLKAKWDINQYSVTFDSDGGTTVDTITQDYNTAVSKPVAPTKTGYTFDGWYENTSIIEYVFNKIESRDVSLKAKWDINQYSITFDSDGGTAVDTITQDYATSVSAPSAPIKTGYTFVGWFEDGETSSYAFNTIEARDVSLKAKWDINQYSITFDSDGGTTVDTITQDFATMVVAPEKPKRPGYNFLGWFEDGETSAYIFDTIEARNVSLKAKWGEAAQYSITFDSNGGSTVPTIIERAGMPVSAPANPTKTGYSFGGWFEDGETSAYVFEVIEERNVALKAKWNINKYSISFDTDGGSEVTTITQDYDTTVVAPAPPIKDGYVFLGWFEDGETNVYEFNKIEARNLTLRAKWAEICGVVTLDKNLHGVQVNGFTQAALNPYVGQEVILPILDSWGYKFLGWKNLTTNQMLEKIDGEYKIIHDGNDVTYQAQWEKISVDSDIV